MGKNEKEHVNLDHARKPHQIAVMQQIVADDRCPFCREHLMQYHTKPILFENEYWILTENFAPYDGTSHHYLLISKKHCMFYWELSVEAQSALFEIFDQVRRDDEMLGGTIVMRWGDTEYTSATVTHLHAQLVTGASKEDGGGDIITAVGYKSTVLPRKEFRLRSPYWEVTEVNTQYKVSQFHYLVTAKKDCVGFWELSKEAQRELFKVFDMVRAHDKLPAGTFIMRFGDTAYSGSRVPFFQIEIISGASREDTAEKILIPLGFKSLKN